MIFGFGENRRQGTAAHEPKPRDEAQDIQNKKDRQNQGNYDTDPAYRSATSETNNKLVFDSLASLLKDKNFLIKAAEHTHQAYESYVHPQQETSSSSSVFTPEQKQALASGDLSSEAGMEADRLFDANMVGVYALQEALGLICSGDFPAREAIKQIAEGTLPKDKALLAIELAHFAWMKSQMWFKGENKPDFALGFQLDKAAKEKAWIQVQAAAQVLAQQLGPELGVEIRQTKLMPSVETVQLSADNEQVLTEINDSLHDQIFIQQAAQAGDAGYRAREKARLVAEGKYDKAQHGWLDGDMKITDKNVAINSVGVLALSNGLNYMAEAHGVDVKEVLNDIISGEVSQEIQDFFCRWAHLGWLKDQPHKNVETTHRDINMYDRLATDVQHKDWAQIVDAAFMLADKIGLPTDAAVKEKAYYPQQKAA